jgi:hypothetical protein
MQKDGKNPAQKFCSLEKSTTFASSLRERHTSKKSGV